MKKPSIAVGVLAVFGIGFNALAQEPVQPSPSTDGKSSESPQKTVVPEQTPSLEISLLHPEQSAPAGTYVSPWLVDVVKLAEARIDDSVIANFIESAGTFNLNPDQIIYLQKLGVSTEITTAMLEHDSKLLSGATLAPAAPSSSPSTVHLNFSSEPSTATTLSPGTKPLPATSSDLSQNASVQTGSETSSPAKLAERDDIEPATAEVGLPPDMEVVSPVRKPYPVQLLDPIIMIRGESRTPNLLVIELP